ncbi:MAG: phage tail tape measure protein [Oscillospiraceae bacterium]
MATDGRLLFDTKVDSSGFEKGVSALSSAAVKSAAAISAAFTAAAGAAIQIGSAYEESLQKVATIADTSIVSIDSLSGSVTALSAEVGTSANELNEALYQAISAGAATADAVSLVEVAVKSAKGGFTDTATAVDGLTSVLNTYGMATKDAESLANKFLITQNKGKTSFGELASSIGNVAPLAATAGVSVEDLLSSVASLTAGGIATSEAMTGIKAALSAIISPSSEASKTAERLGIDFSAAGLQAKGWVGFLEEISVKTGGSTEEMASLFGSVEALNSILSLTSENGMGLLNDTLAEMSTNTTALENAFTTMTDTLNGDIDKAKASLQGLGISVYNGISEKVRQAVQLATGYIGELQAAYESGGLDALSSKVGDVLARASAEIVNYTPDIVSGAVSLIRSFAQGLLDHADEISEAAVTAAFEFAYGLLDALPVLADTAVKLLTSLSDDIGKEAPQLIPAAVECVLTIAQGLLDNFDPLLDSAEQLLVGLCKGLVDAIPKLLEAAPDIIFSLGSTLVDTAKTLWIDLPADMLTTVIDGIKNFDFKQACAEWANNCVDAYNKAVDDCTEALIEIGDRVTGYVTGGHSHDGAGSGGRRDGSSGELISQAAGDNVSVMAQYYEQQGKQALAAAKAAQEEQEKYEKELREKQEEEEKTAAELAEEMSEKIKARWQEISDYTEIGLYTEEQALNERIKFVQTYFPKYNSESHKYYKQIFDDQEKIAEDSTEKQQNIVADGMAKVIKEYDDAMSEIEERRQKYKERLLAVGGSLFDVITEKDEDGNEVTTYTVNNIDEQIKKMRDYHNDIIKLKEDGASYGLLDELNSLDADEAMVFADKIANMSEAERKEIIKLYEERDKVAEELSADMYGSEAQKITDEFDKAMKSLADDAYQAGVLSAEEFAKAFNETLKLKMEDEAVAQFFVNASQFSGNQSPEQRLNVVVEPQETKIYLDNKVVGECVTEYQNSEQRTQGT